ncbi:prephenate dehydrogenase [Tetragenococcus halophilus]|uniref:Prephenate dehydrogenase n=4 Tax=Tetragenococcus halophilus TaxID=51669 RepID=A0A2H6CT84_TETHA|nr:prephenate dehydrogenase [Tetragenococcus halophilus]GMA43408.1 prephenate dehydrogenase [Tetragenococcus halophilus subsp. halophilus DSM 20339]MCF1674961.1 prephenate dehydrogenase [Tetragenococcus halophilus]MCO7025611.1 prephenate dehydrogenase [Tetragenococcus halophilus]MCO8285686.1 prephenate dehydrogenase [Tetragenococcus halophilus]MCO8290278.1 prephenate dehydrogenase [Tetragenococcus halophilus]
MSKQNMMIIGLGLIGSSLAVCIKKEHPDVFLYGWDHEKTSKIAKENKIVDQIPQDFAEAAKKSDVILLAVPIMTAQNYLKKLAELPLKKEVIITDTGSTKQKMVEIANFHHLNFIGGHPMAGSHKSGILACDEFLFENAYYIFTPLYKEQKYQVEQLKKLFLGTRAKYVLLKPEEHDEITGMLSHLPHIIASALVEQADFLNPKYPRAQQLAAGGFRDITRIASSDPQMWTDILLSNRQILLELIEKWQIKVSEISTLLKAGDSKQIQQFFSNAKSLRDRLPIDDKGAIPAFYDLFVDVLDQPGSIAEITGLLGKFQISLTNIKILETREEISGVLQLTFKTERELQAAKAHIEENTDYDCRFA